MGPIKVAPASVRRAVASPPFSGAGAVRATAAGAGARAGDSAIPWPPPRVSSIAGPVPTPPRERETGAVPPPPGPETVAGLVPQSEVGTETLPAAGRLAEACIAARRSFIRSLREASNCGLGAISADQIGRAHV